MRFIGVTHGQCNTLLSELARKGVITMTEFWLRGEKPCMTVVDQHQLHLRKREIVALWPTHSFVVVPLDFWLRSKCPEQRQHHFQ